MRRRWTLTSAGLVVLVLAGCGGGDEPEKQLGDPPIVEEVEPLPDEGLLVSYAREGGIAFSRYAIRINADGTGSGGPAAGTEADVRRFNISPEQLKKLRGLLDETRLPEDREFEAECPDCFIYTIGYGNEEIEWDQVNGPPARYMEIIQYVREIAPIPVRTEEGLPPEGSDGPLLTFTREAKDARYAVTVLANGDVAQTFAAGENAEEDSLPRKELRRLRAALLANPIGDFGEEDVDEECGDCRLFSVAYGGASFRWDKNAEDSQARQNVLKLLIKLDLA